VYGAPHGIAHHDAPQRLQTCLMVWVYPDDTIAPADDTITKA
jgi:hypothetical protein